MLIAIVRRTENQFVQFYLESKQHQHFTVPKSDSYREMTFSNVIFSEFNSKTHASYELARTSVLDPNIMRDGQPTEVDLRNHSINKLSVLIHGMVSQGPVKEAIDAAIKADKITITA